MTTLQELRAPRDGSLNEGAYTLGDTSVAPGERKRGAVPVGVGSNGEAIDFLFEVVRGKYAGPVVLFGAGIHGDEYDSQQAIRQVLATLDPAELHGTFIGMPCMNLAAFAAATRVSGLDHLNLNRIYPGDADGMISERLAAKFESDVIPHVDVFVDFHTGGTFGDIAPLAVVQGGFEEIAQELGMASGNGILWKGGKWSGAMRMGFLRAGKPAVTLEAGGGTFRPSVVEHHFNSSMNILRHIGMVEGESKLHGEYPEVAATFARAANGGFYLGFKEPGDHVKGGDVIAHIIDHFGEVREEVLAPEDGIVLWIRRLRTINPGEETIIFGPVVGTVSP